TIGDSVNLLKHLSVLDSKNVTLSDEDYGCPVLHIGIYSTLAIPAQQAFGLRFEDEFSILLQLRTSQNEDCSLLTLLNLHNHILLQIRLGPHTLTFISAQQHSYEFPVPRLSDSQWHNISIGVSFRELALYVDCALVERVTWIDLYLGIITEGLLTVGGIMEAFETPFEGELRQMTFFMGDSDVAKDHCNLYSPACEDTKKPQSSKHNPQLLPLSSDLIESSTDNDDPLLVYSTTDIKTNAVSPVDIISNNKGHDSADSSRLGPEHLEHLKTSIHKPSEVTKHPDKLINRDKWNIMSTRGPEYQQSEEAVTEIIDLDSVSTYSSHRSVQLPNPEFPDFLLSEEDLLPSTTSTPVLSAREPIRGGHETSSGEQSKMAKTSPTSSEQTDLHLPKAKHGDVITGPDGRTYWLLRGPQGPVGPPGETVSISL
ncbi:collagen alpha-1(XI) chain-like, partial [Denticeps clupeoides]|uniref:collagen alpha-1(XI) chain-like n=1 Tax=Denticeps clupeoides TaxID=299321 RepID=UPI0010A3DFF0